MIVNAMSLRHERVMSDQIDDILPLEQQLALAHSTGPMRAALEGLLLLDNRMARFVSRANEPIVTQLRLAWWRDQLGKDTAERPMGDPVLDALSKHWAGQENVLIGLVDAWEALLAEPPLPDEILVELCSARAKCFAALAPSTSQDEAKQLGLSWAFADFALRTTDTEERAHIIDLAKDAVVGNAVLPHRYRSLTILGRLGQRSLNLGGAPMIGTRRDALFVTRLGLFGR